MAPSCNHEKLECAHFPAWARIRKTFLERNWTPYSLSNECRHYERELEEGRKLMWEWEHQMEQLSENETEIDPDEAEDLMNNLPSPKHRIYRCWNPEYEARRQARKRLWSPPLTPEPGDPKYSLQPSQRPPSPRIRRRNRHQRSPSQYPPQQANPVQLQPPPKGRNKVCKSKQPVKSGRPTTRSMHNLKAVSLHEKKGQVVIGTGGSGSWIATFEQYLASNST